MAQGSTFHLVVAGVDQPLFDGEALSITLPAAAGEITVLPHHEPIVSTLKAGTVRVRSEAGEQEFEIAGGVIECSNNRVVVIL